MTDTRDSGLSLIELLISLGVGSLLLVLLLNGLLSLIKTQRLLLAFNQMEINTHRILNQMQDDIRWAAQVAVPDPQTLEVYTAETKMIVYRWQADAEILTRTTQDGEQILHPEGVTTAEFEVRQLRSDPEAGYLPLVKLLLTVTPADKQLKSKLVLEKQITYTTKVREYEI